MRKGFTLVELIITIGIVALLSITALVGLVRTQDQFAFRAAVKGSANIIREVRSFALGNKTIPSDAIPPDEIIPYQYGAYVNLATNTITTFGDLNDVNKGKYNAPSDYVFDTYQLGDQYALETYDGTTPENQNITLFYQPTTGDFHVYPQTPGSFTDRYVAIEIYDKDNAERSNFIVLFNLSGNPETFDSLGDITD
ncbi:MAG: type II secretion system GspH family protein [Nanoarchaeota archaeon]|nr:type II secretion system GspH family protein [Nanoarchaeota archaeon]